MGSSDSSFVDQCAARTLAVLLVAASCAAAVQAAEPASGEHKQMRAVKVSHAPVMDGKLDDEVWKQAIPITDFHQTRPGDHTPPSEVTEVLVIYTEDALYVAARMADSEPEKIAAPTIRHGQGLGADDRFVLILDPFNSGRSGYRFESNLNGVRHDALYQNVTSFTADWNTIWDVKTSRDDKGWNTEIEIPFKSLPFDPAISTWGFNFGRGIRRRGEEVAWVSYNRTYNPSIQGELTGLTGLNKGIGLDVVPSVSTTRSKRFALNTHDNNTNPSLDVFYRLTPSLNAALTVNTDFSATEVDNRQVNLTRFNLFFPEKRDFFLNDSDLFQFGNIGNTGNNAMSRPTRENARPYFSRKLGLSSTGAPVDINYGARLSGRVGRWNIGTLAIRQDANGAVDASTLLVSRISANVLQDSQVGIILTDGNPFSNASNTVIGTDFRYLNTALGNGRTLEADAWYQQSRSEGISGDDAAWGVGLRTPNNTGWRAGMGYREVERNFNPALGYVNRAGVSDLSLDAGYTWFFRGKFFQQIFSGVETDRIETLGGGLQSEVVMLRLIEAETNTRDRIFANYSRNHEVVQTPFTIYSEPGRSIVIPRGDYRFSDANIGINSGNQRKFSGQLSLGNGDFYNGTHKEVTAAFNWAASRHFLLSLSQNINSIHLPQGDFITRLSSLTTQVAFSSSWFWVTLVQYDNLSEELGINTRVQWIPKAGQEAYVVLNYNMQDKDKDGQFKTAATDLSLKFKYTLRF